MKISPLVVPRMLVTKPVAVTTHAGKDLGICETFEDLNTAVPTIAKSSYNGFLKWGKVPLTEKLDILKRVEEQIKLRESSFVSAMEDTGVYMPFANFNVTTARKQVDHYRSLMMTLYDLAPKTNSRVTLVRRRPYGPVLSISPWNAPIILACRAIMAPLAAGCSVVLKGPEKSPKTVQLLVEAFHDGGVPRETLQLVFGSPENSPELTERFLAQKEIRMVNFTGSAAVGQKIAQNAIKHWKPHLLELGGKNDVIVEADADVDGAIELILFNAWLHQGQICMSTGRVFIHETIYDQFKESLIKAAEKMGPGFANSMRDDETVDRLKAMIDRSISDGATTLYGDYSKPDMPLILENVEEGDEMYYEEAFGPVFLIHRFSNINDLVENINQTSWYGLQASIWTTDVMKASDLAQNLQVGSVHINSGTINDPATTPHGGVKRSGNGFFNAQWGIEGFTFPQTTTIE